jgi:hypothetical protein
VFRVAALPVNTTRILRTRAAALAEPTGELDLTLCPGCGFLFNPAFDEALIQLDAEVEGAQGYSPTFLRFQTALAEELVVRHGLRGGRILEVGCGKGDFLGLLSDVAGGSGLGYDPTYTPGRVARGADRIEVRARLFDRAEAERGRADFICCSMTLEHIQQPCSFVRQLARAAEVSGNSPVMVMVPDAARLLREGHFWDFYYEHCSNFSPGSLARLFRRCGLEVTDLRAVYDDQYLMIEARPQAERHPLALEESPAELAVLARRFAGEVPARLSALKARLDAWEKGGRTVVFWGSGSRATALANLVRLRDQVACFVDINPHRQGTFVPGTGHAIVAPADLTARRPDTVVVLNPIYRDEVGSMLAGLGLQPDLTVL